jgi:ABC-type multidrug transport system ATPase subunit
MVMQRISRLEVENFKSLVDFEMDLPKFSCLIGLNGAGKSTVLQFIDFLSQLVRGDIRGWLAERKWKSTDLKSKLSKKVNIEFRVHFCDENGKPAGRWEAIYSPSKNHCTKERIDLMDFVLQTTSGEIEAFCTKRSPPKGWKNWKSQITFSFEGSILSSFKEDLLPPSILDCKKRLAEIKSLDLLAPEHLRQRTRESSGTLGLGGQNLASFLHEMSDPKRLKMVSLLKKAYPWLQGLHVKSLRPGWKQLEISESYQGQESGIFPVMTTEARHVNDGMLRMIAILAELQSDNRFLLFDEIENGINPELVEFVINLLVEARQQVLVTTHSPMILNYLEDDVAKDGVIYLFKTANGVTESISFFSIPSLSKKLEVMGPGEALVDTNLTELAAEIAEMQKVEA